MYLHVLCNTQIYFFTSHRHNGHKHFGRGAKISWPRVERIYKNLNFYGEFSYTL